MTNVQFISLLTTGIGSFVLVILAWMHQNQRLSDLRGDTQRQFADQRGDTQRQFSDVNRQFDRMNARLEVIEKDMKEFYKEIGRLDGHIEEVARKQV